MNSLPSTNGPNGRDRRGRFGPGNSGGPGNPLAARVARLRAAMIGCVSPKRLRAVVEALIVKAEQGDVAAAREVLNRVLGPPTEGVDLLMRIDAEVHVDAPASSTQPALSANITVNDQRKGIDALRQRLLADLAGPGFRVVPCHVVSEAQKDQVPRP